MSAAQAAVSRMRRECPRPAAGSQARSGGRGRHARDVSSALAGSVRGCRGGNWFPRGRCGAPDRRTRRRRRRPPAHVVPMLASRDSPTSPFPFVLVVVVVLDPSRRWFRGRGRGRCCRSAFCLPRGDYARNNASAAATVMRRHQDLQPWASTRPRESCSSYKPIAKLRNVAKA